MLSHLSPMRFYLALMLACYLSFGHAGPVFGQEPARACEALISEKTLTSQATRGIPNRAHFTPHEALRLIDLYAQIHSQDLNSLNAEQINDLLAMAVRLIKTSRTGFKNFSNSIEKNKEILDFFQAIETRFDELESISHILAQRLDASLTYSQIISYLQAINAVTNYAAQLRDPKIWIKEFGQMQLPYIENKVLIYRDTIRKKIDVELALSLARPRGPWASDSFYIPTDHSLSIIDFNHLVGTGLIPIGFAPEAVAADGTTMLPEEYTIHDQGHSEQMPGRLSEQQLKAWRRLLNWADRGTEQESALRHVLLFQLSHETSFIRLILNPVFNRTVKHDDFVYSITDTPERLRQENFWDFMALKKIENLEAAFQEQTHALEKIIFSNELRSILDLK